MKKVCLIIMDGWGINPERAGNAVALASTPNISRLVRQYPATEVDTSGLSVGLPEAQMGNSEVGHLTIGAGRVIYQELTRIGKAVETGEIKNNPVLNDICDKVIATGGALHFMGLLSDGGVHSHIRHLYGLLDAVKGKGVKKAFVHAFLDGRDTPPKSGKGYIEDLEAYMKKTGYGKLASVIGRYFAMDRDNRWDRVEKAYKAMVDAEGLKSGTAVKAVEDAYAKGETDEFVTPTVIEEGGRPAGPISDGDAVIFFNFRADRAREITRAVAVEDFDGFQRKKKAGLAAFGCLTEYDAKLGLPALFKPQGLENILPDILSRHGIRQFRVSETEKYAHVTFFFNGGKEAPYPGEERLLIPSVKDVPTYDLAPRMRAIEIAEAAVGKIRQGDVSFMLMNFANGDMVGHTGVLEAAIKACEAVDKAVGMVVDEALKDGWAVIVTADHGNAEQMIDPSTNGPHTAHTTNMVPLMLIDGQLKGVVLKKGGLKDIAPTILKLMDIPKPAEMEGEPLF